MRKYFIIIISAFLMLGFFSCKDEEIKRDKEVISVDGEGLIINKETIIIDLDEVGIVDVVTTDSVTYNNQDYALYEVEIEGSMEEAEQIEVGTVLNIPTGNKGGQVMIVYEILPVEENREKGVGAYILKSIQVSLDMYFTYADPIIEFSTPDNRSKKNSVYPDKLTGSELVFSEHLPTFESELEGLNFTTSVEQLFEGSLNTKIWKSGESYIEVNGSFGIHPAIDLYMEYEPQTVSSAALNGIVGLFEAAYVPDLALLFSQDKNYVLGNMKQLRAVVYTDVNKEMSVKVHLEKEFDFVQRIPIGKLTIPTVPVSGDVELAFELDFKAMGTLDFETYKKEEYDIVVGVDLQKDLPDPVWYYEKAYREEDGFQLKAKIELTAGVSIILETEIYVIGVIGPEISMEAYVEAIASVEASVSSENPLEINWELKADAGINGNASLNLAFFHHDPATWKIWEYQFVEYRENIYTAPDHLKVISGADQQGDFGMPLQNPIVIGAFDNKDNLIEYLPVPVYFETENGTVNSVDFTEAGNAEANWILDEENENQTINSYFKFDDVKKGKIQIKATATEHVGPTAPVLLAPINEAIDQEAVNLLIDWEAGDPDESNINYKLYLGESSEFTEADIVFGGIPFTAGEVQLLENTQYFWQVIAIDSEGNETASEVWSFTTKVGAGTNNPPSAPILNSPANGAIDQELNLTLIWNASTDTDGDPVVYDLYTDTEGALGSVTAFDIANTSYSFSGVANKTYYWKVIAKDGNGGEAESAIWSFATKVATGLPILTTEAISNITKTTATSGGIIIDDGGATITARGVCWSTNSNPTITGNYSSDGSGTGTFTSSINGLTAGTTYYVRAYATNSEGAAYGNEQSFITTSTGGQTGTVTDYDGNVYNTAEIGTQIWLREDLRVTHYSDGAEIPYITDNTSWGNLKTPGYSWYNNKAYPYNNDYGALYNWYTVNTDKLCPVGWHIPSEDEITVLMDFLGGESIAGGKLKETGGDHWLSPNSGATDEYNFGALPGGFRYYDGKSYSIWNGGYWWLSTESSTSNGKYIAIGYLGTVVDRMNYDKSNGLSVRCVKD